MFLIILAAAGVVLLLANEKNIRDADRRDAAAVARHKTASIVLNEGSKNCQVKVFDNKTGRISDAHIPCPDEPPSDASGTPGPKGTLHTMNAISKSFR